ncbi:hypothetical protein ABB28_11505 [Stenotrophomonas chelatiphaga]|uniref:DUF4239 domain-containing protein n=1 Tax=Stenotrophomonas chelatiphaga TaxID=517011 RepID=A0A0R0D5W2_9GAMM|nr:DUF4239 domain-containing protein [Stenotrophomonas chelatiphaga]KRG73265.1 hypothetical protein ABB28_11505 [Stenotrophomonas chelatiphaga]
MGEIMTAVVVFACLSAASIGMMFVYPRLSARHRDDETNTVLRLVANIFVVMTSLVFGLLINSSKNTFETIDSNVHAFSTSLIMFDRSLRTYGVETDETRRRLVEYIEVAIAHPARGNDALVHQRSPAANALDQVGGALDRIAPADRFHEGLLADARQQYQTVVRQRWSIVEQSEASVPRLIIWMLMAWLTLIYGSFGYRAPHNPMVVGMFLVSAALIATSVYFVLDMSIPFHGPIQVSDAPLRRALAEIQP